MNAVHHHSFCKESPTKTHEANPYSGSFPQEVDEFLEFVVDFNCKHCGRSGSVRVNKDEINWE